MVVQAPWGGFAPTLFLSSEINKDFYSFITAPEFVCSSLCTAWAMSGPWESRFSNYFHISTAFVSSSFLGIYKNADSTFICFGLKDTLNISPGTRWEPG